MLVGNKCDEGAALREVTELEGKAEASTWGVSFMETSAKNNINVTELFQVNPFYSFTRWGFQRSFFVGVELGPLVWHANGKIESER